MKLTREIKTAILVLSGIALFIYLFTFLRGDDVFSNSDNYYTHFDYNALSESSAVTISGNKVGKVERIKYDYDTGKTVVYFSVDPLLKFSKNSKIRLYQTGLMGGNALAIINAKDENLANPGDFIASEIKPGLVSTLEKDFSGISSDLGATLKSSDTLLNNLNAMVLDESDKGFKQTISELNATLKSYKALSESIQGVIKANDQKIAQVLESFEKTSAELATLTKSLNEADISKTITNFNTSLLKINTLVSGLEAGEGTMGKLLKDEKLYNNIEAATKEMELLLLDIKLHPARYRRILSKKEIPYQKPTADQLNN